MRSRVIQRKYWHVADVPLVIHEWSPETAMNPPDLSALPMWVDLKGVPNQMFSHKGLKCLARTVGTFVKLHPNTEKCTRLDVARLLVEVDLHKPLVEKISYIDKAEVEVVLGASYPWLPPKCEVCRKWGHKGSDCYAKNISILQKDKGYDLAIVVVEGEQSLKKNHVSDLLQELEEFTLYAPLGNGVAVNNMLNSIVLGAGLVEVGQSGVVQAELAEVGQSGVLVSDKLGSDANGKSAVTEMQDQLVESTSAEVEDKAEGGISISPSRFQALANIHEEGEEEFDEGSDTEEGEIVTDPIEQTGLDSIQRQLKSATAAHRGLKNGTHAVKSTKKTFARSKDLKFAQIPPSSKKTFVRKL
ncbi:hypothetical protein YC2023_049554 [Brassica napus]